MSEAIRQEQRVMKLQWREDELKDAIDLHQMRLKELQTELSLKRTELNELIAKKQAELNDLLYGIKGVNSSKYSELDLDYPDLVINIVSEVFKISVKAIKSHSRIHDIIRARNCAASIIYENMSYTKNKMSLAKIGKFLGNKDHSSIVHARKTHALDMNRDAVYRNRVNKVNELIQQNA